MSNLTTPSIAWPTAPVIQPRSDTDLRDQAQKDTQILVKESLQELDEIVHIAGGFPEREPASPARDPAAAELLAPATDQPPVEMPVTTGSAPTSAPLSFEHALQQGVIPTYADQPADVAVAPDAPALDPAAERAAWEQLIAFIEKNKDPGTIVAIVDPDTFSKGLI